MDNNNKKNFNSKGYYQQFNIINKIERVNISNNIISFVNLFKRKINIQRWNKDLKTIKDLNNFFIFLENYNKNYLWNLQQLLCFLPCIKKVQLNNQLIDTASKILGVDNKNILIQDPLILINIPSTKRNLYSWHNAANYYQKRNNYIGMWIPLLIDKKTNNGTMVIAEKSHEIKNVPFLEYQKNSLASHQYAIPEKFFSSYKRKKIELNYGSAIGMHKNLIHSSSINKSKIFSMVLVYKYWEISKDLTLSAKIHEHYFMNDQCAGPDVKAI